MCGIAGFFSPKQKPSADEGLRLINKMSNSIKHRGPDASGRWCDPEHGIFLGHRRLAIQDLTEAGSQPMTSHSGRYVMVYNGEIYNTKEIIQTLKNSKVSITFRGHSDTEVLLESFAILGVTKTLNIIKGMFSIALWDQKEKSLYLIRDHLGKKPLYAGWVNGKISFASELKALKCLAEQRLEISHKAMEHYNYFGFIPAPYSIYKNVFKVKPGHYVRLDEKDIKSNNHEVILDNSQCYWQFKKSSKVIEQNDIKETLKNVLQNSIQQRMMSDVPLGAFLSGGIDSSLITALMQEQSLQPVKTYSIGFECNKFDESPHAAKVAQHLGTEHTTYMVSAEDTLRVIPDLPKIYDEPFADYSQIPTTVLCQQARKDTVVAVSGDGGDEVFCGYKRYFMLKKLLDTTAIIPHPLRKIIGTVLSSPSQGFYNALKVNGKRIHSISGLLQENNIEDAALRTLSINPNAPRPPTLHIQNQDSLEDLERMMMIDSNIYLPDDILVKIDRASMFSSLEVRSPLLDKDVIEFAWQIPLKNKVFKNKQYGKKPLYDLLCDYVPKEIIDRPKQGFTPPIATWLRGPLNEWADSILNSETPLYDQKVIKKYWNQFLQGQYDHHNTLWAILMAQAWYLNMHNEK